MIENITTSRVALSLVLTVFAGVALSAAPETKAGTVYTLDRKASSIQFLADSRFGNVRGTFKKWSFKGKIDPTAATSGTVTIDACSLDTGNGMRDNHLRDEDFFWCKKYPVAVFRIKSSGNSKGKLRLSGLLTLRGVTKAVTVLFSQDKKRPGTWVGRATVKRKQFGLNYESFVNPIKDLVVISVRLKLKKSGS